MTHLKMNFLSLYVWQKVERSVSFSYQGADQTLERQRVWNIILFALIFVIKAFKNKFSSRFDRCPLYLSAISLSLFDDGINIIFYLLMFSLMHRNWISHKIDYITHIEFSKKLHFYKWDFSAISSYPKLGHTTGSIQCKNVH